MCSPDTGCHQRWTYVNSASYCAHVAQDDWPSRLARMIAAQLQHRRKALGLSGRELGERCAQLGFPIHRSVIANLENGRRPVVSVAELLVLAAALDDVPPLRLLAPLDNGGVEVLPDQHVEVLPGQAVNPWEAAGRLAGMGTVETSQLYQYSELVRVTRGQLDELARARREPLGPKEVMSRMIRDRQADLVAIRQQAVAGGLAPPDWPDDVQQRLAEAGEEVSGANRS